MQELKINLEYIDMLAEDDNEFKKDYIDTFKRTYEELIPKMKSAFDSNEMETLGKTAHQLKPSAKMIGLPCADLIEEIQHNPQVAKESDFKDFEDTFNQAFGLLQKWAD